MNPLPMVRACWLRNPVTATLFVVLIALAMALGIAISAQERALRQGSAKAADKFDLIVAAPGSQTDLLFSTVYLRPTAVELLPASVSQQVLTDPNATFAAPIGFGDSYHHHPVIGTTAEFTLHLGDGLSDGRIFATMNEAVVGALVPDPVGAEIEISHGHADDHAGGRDADSVADGDDHDHDVHEDVTIVGRMQPTGTPWDHAIVVPIEYVWFAHSMGTGHAPGDDRIGPPWDSALLPGLPAIVVKPESVAAAYGLRARYRSESSTAFFPAEVLVDLYALLGDATRIMSALTLAAQAMVVAAILAGLMAVLDLQRRRFAVLRALGAPRGYVFAVVWLYVGGLIVAGAAIGVPLGWAAAGIVSRLISDATGVAMVAQVGLREFGLASALVVLGFMLALIPAALLYRRPVVEGLR